MKAIKLIYLLPIIFLFSCEKEEKALPMIEIVEITNIDGRHITVKCNVINEGSSFVTGRGVVWGEDGAQRLNNNEGEKFAGIGAGEFTVSFTVDKMIVEIPLGCSHWTNCPDKARWRSHYAVRAYAINKHGTAYSKRVHFTPKPK